MTEPKFVERRKEYRLPYDEKIIFTDGSKSLTAYPANISRGGIFVKSLDPFPIDTVGFFAFFLPSHPHSFCVKAKVAHIVFDRQRCEVECGMGFQFLELGDSHKSILNLHMLNEQRSYQELKKILSEPRPDAGEVLKHTRNMPSLQKLDLLALRYRVNRICTLFEVQRDAFADGKEEEQLTA